MADKIVQVIAPVFDDKAVKDFSKKMEKINIGTKFTNGLKTAGKIGAVGLGGLTALGLLFRGVTEEANKLGDSIDKILAKADEISTIASDIGVSSGEYALFQAGAGALGLTPEDLSKVINNVQKEQIKGGSLYENYRNMNPLEALKAMVKRWQETKDPAEKRAIESALGMRGKKASEFLQSNIDTIIKEFSNIPIYNQNNEVVGYTNEANLTKNIEKLADLEAYQAKLKQQTDLIDMENKSALINKESIESQAKYQRAFNKNVDTLIEQSGTLYDTASIRENAVQTLMITIATISKPLLQSLQETVDEFNAGKSLSYVIEAWVKRVIVDPLLEALGLPSRSKDKGTVTNTFNPKIVSKQKVYSEGK